MYARVTTYQVQPAKVEEVKQIADESVVPAIKQQHGFKSFMNLIDRSTGKSMLITVFETEADMKAGVSNGFVQQQSAKIAPFVVGTLVSEFYEVNVQG
jgi:heme-degrading monooxygenase HmoA